jgi:hypothetical protein
VEGNRRRKTALAGLVATVAGGLLAVGVAAHTSHTSASLAINAYTLGTTNNYIWGVVSSSKQRCAVERKVRVFRIRSGDDKLLGADVSQEGSTGGPYTVTAPTGDLKEGRYYSKVKRFDLAAGRRHTHLCDGAASERVKVGP